MEKYNIITDKRLMNRMEKKGLITLHRHTGKFVYWWNQRIKAWYIEQAPYKFDFEGQTYGYKYFDGCFNPYLIQYQKT